MLKRGMTASSDTDVDPRSKASPGNIKGAAFREFVLWWEREHGPEALLTALSRIDGSLVTRYLSADRPALGILASVWYPAELPHQMLDGLIGEVSRPELWKIAENGAIAVMSATLKGVYKTAFGLLATPKRYPKYIQRIWNMHYDSGTVIMEEPEPGQHLNRFSDWRSHHRFICALNVASALPIYRAMNVGSVEYEPLCCVSDGARECQSLVRWT